MSYGQRERLLQMEINNLIESNVDEMSLSTLKNKLGKEQSNTPQMSRYRRVHGGAAMRNNNAQEGKINELRDIYSDYRVDGGQSSSKPVSRVGGVGGMMMPGISPRSHGNHLTFEAS